MRDLGARAQPRQRGVLHRPAVALLFRQRSAAASVTFVVVDNVDVGRSDGARVFQVVVLGVERHRVGTQTWQRRTDADTTTADSGFGFDDVGPGLWRRLLVVELLEGSGFELEASIDVASTGDVRLRHFLLRGLRGRLLLHPSSQLEEGERRSDGAQQEDEENDDDGDADVDGGFRRCDSKNVDVATVQMDSGRKICLEKLATMTSGTL